MPLSYFAAARARGLGDRGAHRLSGASLSRDWPPRHLDGPLARDSGSAVQSAVSQLRRATGAGRRRAIPHARAGRACRLGGDARACLLRRLRLRRACAPCREPARAAQSRRPCPGGRRRARREPGRGTPGGRDDRRAQSESAGRSRRRARGDREPGREFLRRGRRADPLDRARRAYRRRALTRRSTPPTA